MSFNYHRLILALLVFCSLVLVTGCGKRRGTVTGKVTYENRPLAIGVVILAGSDNQPVVANIEPDGTYTAKDVAFGTVKVAVSSPQPKQRGIVLPEKKGMVDKAKEALKDSAKGRPVELPNNDPSKWIEIPEKYATHETSGITFTLNQKTQTFDIPLKAN